RTTNKIIPEITNIGCSEQDKDKRLCRERREKYRRAGCPPNKKSCQKKTENTAIEHRAQNVARFDQIFYQTCKGSDSDCDKTPRSRQRFRRDHVMVVGGVRTDQGPIEIDLCGGAESIQSCCRRRHSRAQNHCDE